MCMDIFQWFLEIVIERCTFHSVLNLLLWKRFDWFFFISIKLKKSVAVIDCKLEFEKTFEKKLLLL